MSDRHIDPAVRHELVLLFDVHDGNPNGDPDGANQPRLDPETGQGLVTDVCIKRKIRNFVDLKAGDGERTKIFVQAGVPLNAHLRRAYEALGIQGKQKGKSGDAESIRRSQAWMCENFFDVRMFGAVMSTGTHEAGKVQGPMQLTFGRSIDPILAAEHGITRVAPTREEEADKATEMGSKWTVPYALYRMHGFFSASLAARTGVTGDDLTLLYEAVCAMFDTDRSAARGEMAVRGLHVFSHSSVLGDAPASAVLERIQVRRREGVGTARSFGDYQVIINAAALPEGVSVTSLVGG